MTNGVCVFVLKVAMLMTLKLSITIKENHHGKKRITRNPSGRISERDIG